MVQQSTYVQIDLDVGEAVSLFHAKGRSLRCLSGTLWVTEVGERKDLALAAGEVYHLTRRGRTVIQAVGSQQGATCLLAQATLQKSWGGIVHGIIDTLRSGALALRAFRPHAR